ncbi:tyrosine-type recombinase/integrase [Methylorubrum extorquens]|uniref:site-specific integrase n=1 Tax=Methylorubrum extorquens TaxID=408 RepID=UPI0022379B64|nr:site-specific integrase [Methylorubrum extorquens]UYW25893.1 tyrosine-type recombinase/integrase [Methylorubrum extorquens]
MNLLPVPAAPAGGVSLDRARAYAAEARSERTRKAYTSALRVFVAWGDEQGLDTLPARPEVVAAYVAHLADTGRKPATINLHVAAIAAAHRLAGFDVPTASEAVKATLRGVRRTLGTRQTRKAPVTAETLKKALRKIPDDLSGARDRALLLIGFAAALRRSELVALDVTDLERVPDGIIVHVRRSKTDQDGHGQEIAVPRGGKLKPCDALDAWLAAAKITAGPVFRPINKGGRVGADRLTDRSVADIVKRHVSAAGLDASLFSGHSLRAGFVTSALAAGADVLKVMHVTRHTAVTTLQKYDRRARAFDDHAGRKFL